MNNNELIRIEASWSKYEQDCKLSGLACDPESFISENYPELSQLQQIEAITYLETIGE